MTEKIDYKAVSEKLQRDLEEARLAILKMHTARSFLDKINGESIRNFVQRNYTVIVLILLAVSYIGGLIIEWRKSRV